MVTVICTNVSSEIAVAKWHGTKIRAETGVMEGDANGGGWKLALACLGHARGEPNAGGLMESTVALKDRGMKLWTRHFAPTQAEVRKVRMSTIPAGWRLGRRTEVKKQLAQRDQRKVDRRRSAYQDWGKGGCRGETSLSS